MEGSWLLVPPRSEDPTPLEQRELEKERARVVLNRYGVVFKELLDRELPAFRWGALQRALRLMELSAEVVAGPVIDGPLGLQFALPDIAERLRSAAEDDRIRIINAVDPASPVGLGIPGLPDALPTRIPGNHLVYHGGELVLVSRRNGKELQIMVPPEHPDLCAYVSQLRLLVSRRVGAISRVAVETVNDEPVRESRYADAIASAGFRRGHRAFTLQAGYH